jgi:hypothetical protein
MACWGPSDTDPGLSASCMSTADTVQECEANASIVPMALAQQSFYDCLVAAP